MMLSIVSTLYNNERYVGEFLERIIAQATRITDRYEIVLIDDGSSDRTVEVTRELLKKHKNIRLYELSRNFGHHRAMMTGLIKAQGEYVFLIDSDLDEPPELLGTFYEMIESGDVDVVYGCQDGRKGRFVERVGGQVAWAMIDLLSEVKIPRNLSTVRLMRREYVNALTDHLERKTAIGGLWAITGFKQIPCSFKKNLREESGYSLKRRLSALLDSLTAFSEKPLYFVFLLGISIFLLSTLVAVVLVVWRLSGTVLQGWVSILVSVWMLGGLMTLCIGIVGLYVSRIFVETKNRPYSIVRREYRSD